MLGRTEAIEGAEGSSDSDNLSEQQKVNAEKTSPPPAEGF